MTGTATTLLIFFCRPKQKFLFELHAGNVYVEYRAALNTTKYFFAKWSVSLCNVLFLNPNAMRHYLLIGVQRNKSVYREQSL